MMMMMMIGDATRRQTHKKEMKKGRMEVINCIIRDSPRLV